MCLPNMRLILKQSTAASRKGERTMPGGYSGLFEGTKGARREPFTNADRIRGMSDEELADYIFSMQKQMCRRFSNIIEFTEPLKFASSAPDLLDWLRQPAEEVHDAKW